MRRSVSSLPSWAITSFSALAVFWTMTCWTSNGLATEEPSATEQAIEEALAYYQQGEFDQAIDRANQELAREHIAREDSVAVLELLGALYYSKGQEFYETAFEYLNKLGEMNPCVQFMPSENWPPGLRYHWYEISYDGEFFMCTDAQSAQKTTIAIMDFDNESPQPYQDELGALGRGLAKIFTTYFRNSSTLTVVERDKLAFLIEELELSETGKIDKASALKAGKLLGAQMMVFGSITQITQSQTAMSIWVDDVETGKYLVSTTKIGKPDYFKLARDAVKEICDSLDFELAKGAVDNMKAASTSNLEAALHYSQGLRYEDQKNYRAAHAEFKSAFALDPEFAEAGEKVRVYSLMTLSSTDK